MTDDLVVGRHVDGGHLTAVDDLSTSWELCHHTGLTYRMCDHWVRRGVLRVANQAKGSGTTRVFIRNEVALAAVLAEARRQEVTLAALIPVAERLRDCIDDVLDGRLRWLVMASGRVEVAPSDGLPEAMGRLAAREPLASMVLVDMIAALQQAGDPARRLSDARWGAITPPHRKLDRPDGADGRVA